VALDRQADDLARRTLTTLDDVRVQGSIVTGSVQALAGEARSLEHRASDDAERRRLANLAGGLEGLAHALETDRSLRLASPPASEAQLNYSTSLIRRHVDEVDSLLRPPPGRSSADRDELHVANVRWQEANDAPSLGRRRTRPLRFGIGTWLTTSRPCSSCQTAATVPSRAPFR
jgi:hypothetical protein